MLSRLIIVLALAILGDHFAWADSAKSVRWTFKEDSNGNFDHVIEVLKQKTGYSFKKDQFLPLDSKHLSTSDFTYYAQTVGGIPIKNKALRIWIRPHSDLLIQAEALVDDPTPDLSLIKKLHEVELLETATPDQNQNLLDLAKAAVKSNADDPEIRGIQWKDFWQNNELIRVFEIKGKHGRYQLTLSREHGRILKQEYEEYPQNDVRLDALVYPIFEETESAHHIQTRIPVKLRHLKPRVHQVTADPYGSLRTQHYTEDKFDPVLGEIPQGRAQGFWSMTYIKEQAAQIRETLPLVNNDFTHGMVLEGRYATVNLHPAVGQVKGLNFTPSPSAQFKPDWQPIGNSDLNEMIPRASLLGRPLTGPADALNRPARRLPDHDLASYINDGFDEVQVYYAIDTLFSSLHKGGWRDLELSTRPFNAFLYDPDVSMRDNAYYTDDTINFTTYSPGAQNFARDNSTIWHELGHGVMDRMMGDYIQLADTGGLSEGMADFVAALVIADVSHGKPFEGSDEFRIINHTGFNLTNEVHDDGEAYGGAMRDFMEAVLTRDGRKGLKKVVDLTLETMRLTRDHPGLTAEDWFSHMLFADALGHQGIRAEGELSPLITQALAGRNFSLSGKTIAQFSLKNDGQDVIAKAPGSRQMPIRVELKEMEKVTYHLQASVKNGEAYPFKFPVQVKVFFRPGPLQGAIHWEGEEAEPIVKTLQSENDVANIDLTATGKCDFINREDGSCVDYAYIQIWNDGETKKPQAKKRFYLRIKPVQ